MNPIVKRKIEELESEIAMLKRLLMQKSSGGGGFTVTEAMWDDIRDDVDDNEDDIDNLKDALTATLDLIDSYH